MSPCPRIEHILQWAEGALAPELARQLLQHVNRCVHCRRRLHLMEILSNVLMVEGVDRNADAGRLAQLREEIEDSEIYPEGGGGTAT